MVDGQWGGKSRSVKDGERIKTKMDARERREHVDKARPQCINVCQSESFLFILIHQYMFILVLLRVPTEFCQYYQILIHVKSIPVSMSVSVEHLQT